MKKAPTGGEGVCKDAHNPSKVAADIEVREYVAPGITHRSMLWVELFRHCFAVPATVAIRYLGEVKPAWYNDPRAATIHRAIASIAGAAVKSDPDTAISPVQVQEALRNAEYTNEQEREATIQLAKQFTAWAHPVLCEAALDAIVRRLRAEYLADRAEGAAECLSRWRLDSDQGRKFAANMARQFVELAEGEGW